MTKRAILYTRVSTDEQAAHGYSLPTQLAGCREYAQAHGFDVAAELADDCSGAIPIAERPKGRKLYDLVDRDSIAAVILYTHDRTARDDKVIEYLLLKSYLYDRGCELHYSDTGLDPYTMEGNLVGYIKAHAAADERRKIRERSVRGKLAKARDGQWVGATAPYGYRKVGVGRDTYLEIDEPEAAVVRRIYAMYLGRDGYDLADTRGIAVALTAERIPRPGRSARGTGPAWSQETIRYILMNPAYIGKFRYGDVVIDLPHLAIIDREVWDVAQERRKRNGQRARRNRKYEYLLAGGYLRCSCGWAMRGHVVRAARGRIYVYYVCPTDDRRDMHECREGSVRGDIVDALVWGWLYTLLADDAHLEAGLAEMAERSELELSPKRDRLATMVGLIGEMESQIKRLATAYAEAENDAVAEALKAELKNAGKKLDALRDESARLDAEIGMGKLSPDEVDAIKRLAASLRADLDAADFETKRGLLDSLNFQTKLLPDLTADGERQLEVSCSLVTDPARLSIVPSRSWWTCRATLAWATPM
ncbi:MAG: recombinase family protein [Chloroflexi bacterium]|nr:recombinase family protein [Chloroflexota bacterium]MBU1748296.1 recombinase family protein [Chloroflexota bacterium]